MSKIDIHVVNSCARVALCAACSAKAKFCMAKATQTRVDISRAYTLHVSKQNQFQMATVYTVDLRIPDMRDIRANIFAMTQHSYNDYYCHTDLAALSSCQDNRTCL